MNKPILVFAVSVRSAAPAERVFALLADPSAHLQWCGERAPSDGFKLLSMTSPAGPAAVGSTFSSTGANGRGVTFHDRSTVTEVAAPAVFAFGTDSTLVRKHRPDWQAHFDHRYEVRPDGTGCRIVYTADVYPLNYRPYWLHPLMRPMTRVMVPRMMARNLRQLAAMAEGYVSSDRSSSMRTPAAS
jgi:hypothetical protein